MVDVAAVGGLLYSSVGDGVGGLCGVEVGRLPSCGCHDSNAANCGVLAVSQCTVLCVCKF